MNAESTEPKAGIARVAEHIPLCDRRCGGNFTCAGCKRLVGWCDGQVDDMPEHCSACWAAAHPAGAERSEPANAGPPTPPAWNFIAQYTWLVDRLERSWWRSVLRGRTKDRLREDIKRLRTARTVRLWVFWTRDRAHRRRAP